jgi:hypothetical protein
MLGLQVWGFISDPALGWLQREKATFVQEEWMKGYHKIQRITVPQKHTMREHRVFVTNF